MESPRDLSVGHRPYQRSAEAIGAGVCHAPGAYRTGWADRAGVLDHQHARTGVGVHTYISRTRTASEVANMAKTDSVG
jgi:hypothetical protein